MNHHTPSGGLLPGRRNCVHAAQTGHDGAQMTTEQPFRTIIEHGVQCGIMGDGVHIAPLNPWLHIYYAVTGVNSFGAKVNGDQQLTRQEALRLFTRGNSWFLRMEEKVGSLEPNKLADLVVLDRDYFTVPDVQIKQIKSLMTIVDGKVVHGTL